MARDDSRDRTRTPSRFGYFGRALVYFVFLAVINVGFRPVVYRLMSPVAPTWLTTLLEGAVYLAGVVALTWAFCRYLDRSSLGDLGLRGERWFTKLASGWGLGAFLILLMFATYWIAGWLTVQRAPWQSWEFLASVLLTVVVSFNEELAFRGYIMQRLGSAWGMPTAVAVTSILFGLVHLFNPEANLLGALSITVIGLLFALGYLVTRSLWFPIGLHMSWNLVEMHILGFPGSGYIDPSFWRSTVHGPEVMTGGAFGPEGGVVSLGVALVGIAFLLVGYRIALAGIKQN